MTKQAEIDMKVIGYPFNDRAVEENRRHFDSAVEIKKFLNMKFGGGYHFGTDNLLREGLYREMAFSYNFRGHLKKWLVHQDGHYCHYWAPSVTALRRAAYLPRQARVWPFPDAAN